MNIQINTEQLVEQLKEELQEMRRCSFLETSAIRLADIDLRGQPAQIQLVITKDEDDFVESEPDAPAITIMEEPSC